jgi:hypothetical protein
MQIETAQSKTIRESYVELSDGLEIIIAQQYYVSVICYDGEFYEITQRKLANFALTDMISDAIAEVENDERSVLLRVMYDNRAEALKLVSDLIAQYY